MKAGLSPCKYPTDNLYAATCHMMADCFPFKIGPTAM